MIQGCTVSHLGMFVIADGAVGFFFQFDNINLDAYNTFENVLAGF